MTQTAQKLKIRKVRKGTSVSWMAGNNAYKTVKAPAVGFVFEFGEKSVYVTKKELEQYLKGQDKETEFEPSFEN